MERGERREEGQAEMHNLVVVRMFAAVQCSVHLSLLLLVFASAFVAFTKYYRYNNSVPVSKAIVLSECVTVDVYSLTKTCHKKKSRLSHFHIFTKCFFVSKQLSQTLYCCFLISLACLLRLNAVVCVPVLHVESSPVCANKTRMSAPRSNLPHFFPSLLDCHTSTLPPACNCVCAGSFSDSFSSMISMSSLEIGVAC